jgi:small subunit ribosomal protein S2
MVDTNSDPRKVEFPIPANDDASKSITKVLDVVASAIAEGLEERKSEKDKRAADKKAKADKKAAEKVEAEAESE